MSFDTSRRFISIFAISVLLWPVTGITGDLVSSLSYSPRNQAVGTITAVGSDTMADVVSYWIVGFKKFHPDVQARLLLGGSATAAPALIDGSGNIGPMSRKMKDSEVQAFVKKFGYEPTGIRVGMDALAVYVHKDNPIKGMTLAEVDAVFSSTRKCGLSQDITTWGQLELEGEWRNRSITLYSRNTLSGTYAFFSEHALCKGQFKNTVNMQASSHDVVRFVKASPEGIGYSGIGFQRDGGIRAIPIARKAGEPFVAPTPENVYSGKYPLSRFLYVYANKAPGQPLPALEREFVRLMLSADGQARVTQIGFIPLGADVLREELAKLN